MKVLDEYILPLDAQEISVIVHHPDSEVLHFIRNDSHPLPGTVSLRELLDRFRYSLQGFQILLPSGSEWLSEYLPDAEASGKSACETILLALKNKAHVMYFNSVAPAWDPVIAEKLYGAHVKFVADVSFPENTIPGSCPAFFSADFLNQPAPPDSEPLAYVMANINQYHCEIHYELPDLRQYRLDFTLSGLRSAIDLRRLWPHIRSESGRGHYGSILQVLNDHPDLLLSRPSYFEIELYRGCDLTCIFCPRQYVKFEDRAMSEDIFSGVLKSLDLCYGDATVTLGGMGEPFLHPEFPQYLKELLHSAAVQVIVETNGRHLHLLPELTAAEWQKLTIIVNLNAVDSYTELHGSGAPSDVVPGLKNLVSSLPGGTKANERIWLQMLKINENEKEIDAVYGLSREIGVNFLLQKYNRYAGLMPERRVSDMTPLERHFCWHLRRDVYITVNGDLSFCKQDIEAKSSWGNIRQEDFLTLWSNRESAWIRNFRGEVEAAMPCADCDEYFTFNF